MPKSNLSNQSRALKSRYQRILRFAALALAQAWWFEIVLPQFGLKKIAARGRIRRFQKLARKFHNLAADLGGLMVKVGQFLSARLDVLPEEITKELSGLQDEVAPESFESILHAIESELGMSPDVAFAEITAEPIAAASLGQAYKAKLSPGLAGDLGITDVVVKVLRPGIENIVDVDLKALTKVGGWLSKVKLVSKRTDAPALVREFSEITLQEINYLHEAENLERFAKAFENDPRIQTPNVIWERSAKRVLTLTDVSAIKISDVEGLVAAGINPNAVAAELARATFEQFFVTGFFHADPHPGNIFITKAPEGAAVDFSLTYIDFGMMGQVSEELKANLQRFLFAVASRDARAWVVACERLGVLLPSADTLLLEEAVSKLFDRFGGVRVGELIQTDPAELREFGIEFSELVRTLPFQLPNDFLFLIRALSLISGVTSELNREFNIWDAVDPFARSLLNGSGAGTLKRLGKDLFANLVTLSQLPGRIESVVSRVERGDLVLRNPELERRMRVLDSSIRRATAGLVFTGLVISGVLSLPENQSLGLTLLGISALPMLYALGFGRFTR
ncbi:ABC1 kinase family protein [Rhodoluna lacicola]|uniref:ABC1 kinase family protein n=1 Tax=Rhodoluna lacicola TaxID=529884 RepID=UPI00222FC155|nr:AarF/UbiB family protein [Rhodoluna lacicola]